MPKTDNITPKFTDPVGACARLTISRPTLYRLIASDSTFPPKLKVGRSTRFEIDALDAWMLARATDN